MFTPSTQKLGVIMLALLTVGIAAVGSYSLRSHIQKPFFKTPPATVAPEDEEARLKSQDTDKDGLSDYDELKLYGTSAYLKDTDSDGVNDADEISAGDDPNCAKGADCTGATLSPTTAVGTTQPPIGVPSVEGLLQGSVLGTQPDPAILRKLLLDAGLDPKTLNTLDDAALMKLYQETIAETPKTDQGPPLLPSFAIDDPRAFLLKSGIDKKTLEGFTDAQLKEMVRTILGGNTTTTKK